MKRCLFPILVSLLALPAQAVIVLGGSGRNLTPPPDAARRACWDLQGEWGNFSGTPIAPHWFVSAEHVGASVGDTFSFAGKAYHTVAVELLPGTDLALWRVHESFPRWAPLATESEQSRPLLILGRGTARGAALPGHGWSWGADDHRRSWGSNQAAARVTSFVYGDLLTWTFDANAGPEEGTLSSGDSGGAVFAQERDSQWRLAGINHDINPGQDGRDRFYAREKQGTPGFLGAIYDGNGWFLGPDNQRVLLSGHTPMTATATPIAPYLPWIRRIVARPDSDYPRQTPLLAHPRQRRAAILLVSLVGIAVLCQQHRRNTRAGARPVT